MSNKLPLPNASRTREMLNTLGKRTGRDANAPPTQHVMPPLRSGLPRPSPVGPLSTATSKSARPTPPSTPETAAASKIISSEKLEAARRARSERAKRTERPAGASMRLNRPAAPRVTAGGAPDGPSSLGDTIAAAHNALDKVLGRAEPAPRPQPSTPNADLTSGFQRSETRPNQRTVSRAPQTASSPGGPVALRRELDDMSIRDRILAVNWDRKTEPKILPEAPMVSYDDMSIRDRILAVNWDRDARVAERPRSAPAHASSSSHADVSSPKEPTASVDAFFSAIDW